MVMFMNSTKAADYKCPSCKAPLLFDPELGKWKCNYCESVFSLEELENKNVKVEVNDDNVNYDHYICKNCGAEIIAEENTAATFCLYCGNTAIIKERLSGDFKPSKVIPFKKEDEKKEQIIFLLKTILAFVIIMIILLIYYIYITKTNI